MVTRGSGVDSGCKRGGNRRALAAILVSFGLVSVGLSPIGAATAAKRKGPGAVTTVNPQAATKGAPTSSGPTVPTTVGAPPFDPCAVRIMPLGDSITAFPEGFRGPLFRLLKEKKLSVDLVGSVKWDPAGGGDPDAEGHGGFTIGPDARLDGEGKPGNLSQRVAEWVPKADPDIILLQIGTNDLGAGNEYIEAAPKRIQDLVAQLTQLAPNAWIVVGTLIPIRGWKEGRPEVRVFNDAVRAIGDARPDDRVVTAELWDYLGGLGYDTDRDTSDGTHPNKPGGEKVAAAWLPWLVPAVERKAAAACK
jgi:acyl-CoA thioesterase I